MKPVDPPVPAARKFTESWAYQLVTAVEQAPGQWFEITEDVPAHVDKANVYSQLRGMAGTRVLAVQHSAGRWFIVWREGV